MIGRIKSYLTDVRQEMAKVSWPTFHELLNSTQVVIVVTVVFAIFLFGIDRIFTKFMQYLIK